MAVNEQTLKAVMKTNNLSRRQAEQAFDITREDKVSLSVAIDKLRNSSDTQKQMQQTLPEDPTTQFATFTNALNKAVSLGRKKRQDQTLDFLEGKIEPGSVSASSFSGLLADVNNAFEREAIPLAQSTLEFAQQQQQLVQESKDRIRELGIELMNNGVKPENIQAVLAHTETGDIEAAMVTAASVLETSPQAKEFQFFKSGDNIIGVNKRTGESQVVFNPNAPDPSDIPTNPTPIPGEQPVDFASQMPEPGFFTAQHLLAGGRGSNNEVQQLKQEFPNQANKIDVAIQEGFTPQEIREVLQNK